MQEMLDIQVRSLGQEDPLEKEMATHSGTLAWKIPWMEKPGRLQSMGGKESDMTERLHFHFALPDNFPCRAASAPTEFLGPQGLAARISYGSTEKPRGCFVQ